MPVRVGIIHIHTQSTEIQRRPVLCPDRTLYLFNVCLILIFFSLSVSVYVSTLLWFTLRAACESTSPGCMRNDESKREILPNR